MGEYSVSVLVGDETKGDWWLVWTKQEEAHKGLLG